MTTFPTSSYFTNTSVTRGAFRTAFGDLITVLESTIGNTSGQIDLPGTLTVRNQNASSVGATIRAAASQTADILQVQDSASTVLARIYANGAIDSTGISFGANTGISIVSSNPRITLDANDFLQYTRSTDTLTWNVGNSAVITVGSQSTIFGHDLVAEDPTATLTLRANATVGYRSVLSRSSDHVQTSFTHESPTGSALLNYSPVPVDGTSAATVRFFRDTNTSGTRSIAILAGDGTTNTACTLAVRTSKDGLNITSSNCVNFSSNVGVGTTNPLDRLHVESAGTTRVRVTNSANSVTSVMGVTNNSAVIGTTTAHSTVIQAHGNTALTAFSNATVNIASLQIGGVDLIRVVADIIYPVGSIISTSNNVNPGTRFSGTTWVQTAQGRVLIGVGSGTDVNGETVVFAANATGGEYSHTLTIAEMPLHGHPARYSTDPGGATGTGGMTLNSTSDGNYGAHTGTPVETVGDAIGGTGGGQAHNNVQPYRAIYYWERTA